MLFILQIQSLFGEDLTFKSARNGIYMSGNQGVSIKAKSLTVSGKDDFTFSVENKVNVNMFLSTIIIFKCYQEKRIQIYPKYIAIVLEVKTPLHVTN